MLVFVQATVPFYRVRLIELMAEDALGGLAVYVGHDYFDRSIVTDPQLATWSMPLQNRYFLGRRALWQHGAVAPGVRAHQLILEFNPRILSVWVTLCLRRIYGKDTTLFGHAWARRGHNPISDRLRDVMRQLAGRVVVYTESEAAELRRRDPHTVVVAAGNAVYALSDAGAAPTGSASPHTFIYVGRLVAVKKPRLLLQAFLRACDAMPGARLMFVGEGPEREGLERAARGKLTRDQVQFTGHIDRVGELRDAYSNAVASVSPGYAGLSLTQSLWFGVPMLIAREEPHAPEIEAARAGETAYFCRSDDPDAMAVGLVRFWSEREVWAQRREAIASNCATRYSLDMMAARLVGAASGVTPNVEVAEGKVM